MSVFCKQLKSSPMGVGNLLQIIRGYATSNKIPITWIMPKKISCVLPEKSGDGGLNLKIKPEDAMTMYDKSQELENANDIVKRMFSVGFNPRREYVALSRERAFKLVQRHSHDKGSTESIRMDTF